MSTDLFGVPLGEAPVFELSPHQKRQATLLYHWTSGEYLQGLLVLIDDVTKGADNCLSVAHTQRRDELIANPQWGVRDTAGNWASLAWPALEDFKQSTIRLMGWRLQDMYCGTDLTQCDRMLSEISPYWMTPEEKTWFDSRWGIIDAYASRLDQAVGTGSHRPMDDLEMTLQWEEFGD